MVRQNKLNIKFCGFNKNKKAISEQFDATFQGVLHNLGSMGEFKGV